MSSDTRSSGVVFQQPAQKRHQKDVQLAQQILQDVAERHALWACMAPQIFRSAHKTARKGFQRVSVLRL